MSHLLQLLTLPATRLWPLAAMLLLLPCIALAGGKATMKTTSQPIQVGAQPVGGGESTMTLVWRDAKTMRMDFGDDAALIIRDGKTYSISQSDGQIQVMDMAAMMKMMQAVSGQGTQGKNPLGSIDSVKATGATETVAGIKGRVYHMTWTNPDGKQQSGDAVLTNDPLVVEMTVAWLGSMSGMVDADTANAFLDGLPSKDRGLLRMGNQIQVESVSRSDPPASTFELPAKPMDLQSLMGGMGQ